MRKQVTGVNGCFKTHTHTHKPKKKKEKKHKEMRIENVMNYMSTERQAKSLQFKHVHGGGEVHSEVSKENMCLYW